MKKVIDINSCRRNSAGARTIAHQLTQESEDVNRYKNASSMKRLSIISKQSNKIPEDISKIATNLLHQNFILKARNQV